MTSSFEEWLSSAKRQYLEAKELNEVLSRNDSEDKPYESKYKAKEIIERLEQQLSQLSVDSLTDELRSDLLVRVLFEYDIGSIDLDTEEIGLAEKRFKKCIDLLSELLTDLKTDKTRADIALTLFKVVANNQLAFIWCTRAQYSKAEPYLKNAEKAYIDWETKDEELKKLLLDFLDVFSVNALNQRSQESYEKAVQNVESGHTLTLYLMAQIYEKLGENSKSAVYCHSTLKRQYRQMMDNSDNQTETYDRIDWSLNAATLSQYFATNSDFDAARHHICCALKVINGSKDIESDKFKKCLADLNRIVVKYSLMLLDESANAIRDERISDSEPKTETNFKPYLLNDPEVEELEKSIETFPIITLSEAQRVFKHANNCLNEAITFYTLDERASDYVECVQDRSKLYQYLIPYDEDLERQCKMHKRRIDCLERVLQNISPNHFMGQCRQIMFELAEIYTQMAELKIALMEDKTQEEQKSAIKKINLLIRKAISYYDDFQKTFVDKSTNKLPEILPEDYIRPILLSQFSIGRLHTKLMAFDPRVELQNWSKCEQYYTQVRDYLERNPQQKFHLEEELPLLEEMLKLIPQKMQTILSATLY